MKKVLFICLVLALASGCIPQELQPGLPGQDDLDPVLEPTLTNTPLVIAPPENPYQTPDPDAPTRTLNPSIPTLTPTITLTATSTPTATPDPEDPLTSLGDPWFLDDFDSGANFFLYDEAQSSFLVENNQMILVAKKANNYETWSLASPNIYNYYLEITGSFGDECSGKDRYGMIFRARDTSEGYLISIACDGSYRLSSYESEKDKYSILVPWTASEIINPGPGSENRLGIKTSGILFTGYINGRQVFEIEDSTFGSGRFGILVAATDTEGFTAYLDQVAYWALPED